MPYEQSNGTGARRTETEFPMNAKGKEVKPMRNDDAKVITIQKTVKESWTETVKIEVKPMKARKMAKTKENTTTPETVVVFHSRG